MARKPATLTTVPAAAHQPGLLALDNDNQNKLNLTGLQVQESVNLDLAFQPAEPNATRWDYYIGIAKHGEIYLEVHKLNDAELDKLLKKAEWLRSKIAQFDWPATAGRPLFLAPTSGIPLSHGHLAKQLALKKILVVRKGDLIAKIL
jgi:hypothetical protein